MSAFIKDQVYEQTGSGHVFEKSWCHFPEDTLDALDLLLVYMGINSGLNREVFFAPLNHKKPGEEILPMRSAIRSRGWRNAVTLLYPARRKARPDRGTYWCLNPRRDYRERLGLAGIDMDTVKIVDLKKFAWAWFQLTEGFTPHFSIVRQKKLLGDEHAVVPEIKPVTNVKRLIKRDQPGDDQLRREAEIMRKKKWLLNDQAEKGIEPDYESLGTMLLNKHRSTREL